MKAIVEIDSPFIVYVVDNNTNSFFDTYNITILEVPCNTTIDNAKVDFSLVVTIMILRP